MADVRFGLIEGAGGNLDNYGWQDKKALLKVEGVTHVSGKDDLAINAILAIDAAGYTYGSTHPVIDTLFMLGPRVCTVVGKRAVDIEVTYRRKNKTDPNYIEHTGETVLVQERTNLDAAGDDIVLEWKPESGRDAQKQSGLIDKWLPSTSLEFSQTILTNPAPVARRIVGFANKDNFQGDEPGSWLCFGCGFGSPDGGVHHATTMKFVRNAKLWKQTLYYICENGRPPANFNAEYNAGKAVQEIEVYGKVNFGDLNLPNVYATTEAT
jgi:hypothetical protein